MEFLNLPIIKNFYFKLNKNDKSKIKIIMPKPEIEDYHNILPNNTIDEEFKNDVDKFKKVISRNINRKFLNSFYKNLNNLTITKNEIKKEKKQVLEVKGCYYQEENKVILSNKLKPDTIFHELFHVASSTIKNGNIYSGISQYFFYKGKWISIAEGINEGLTQVLTERYFPHKKQNTSSYPFEKDVVLCIENLIGRRKLEEFYFTNNLNGLIEELRKYTDNLDDIDTLILKIDYINKSLYNKIDIENIPRIDKSIKQVSLILIKLKTNQLKIELDNNKISKKEFDKSLISYISILSKSIKVRYNKFNFINIKDVEKYLKDFSKNDQVKIKKK